MATIGQLSAGVAHELNEPLGSILGFAQLLTKDKGLPEQASMDINEIIKSSLHAREIIRKLMLFSKQLPPMTSKVDLNNIVREDLYFLKSRCNKENITLVDRLDPELPRSTADKSQLHQVLVNLVVNAIQAMPDGGEITISTRHDDKNVYLAVSDTGIGMNEKIIKQIFVPFFTTKEISQGTGLGLSVVHGIITAHHGSIDVKSKVGKGSIFEVRLPISHDGEEA
ncbi:MAG: ATP-binding protein [Proteobacteria bacterium]|nr:ATP-binding protein [Pseudomonadota bacterium]